MYSNDLFTIKAGLTNYVGAMLKASPLDNDKAKKHSVVATLLEEAMQLCKDDTGTYDMFVCKPILRLNANIIQQRIKMLEELSPDPEVIEQVNSYKFIYNEINKIIENTKL